MRKTIKKIFFTIFFLNICIIFITPTVKATITVIDEPYFYHEYHLNVDKPVWAPDTNMWLERNWANETGRVVDFFPSTVDGQSIVSRTILNATIFEIEVNNVEYVTSFTFKMNNWSSCVDPPYWYTTCNYDYEVATTYPPTLTTDIFYVDSTFEDYLKIVPQYYFRGGEDFDRDNIAGISDFQIELNASISYFWLLSFFTHYDIECEVATGGFLDFTELLLFFLGGIVVYLAIIYAFGIKYGIMGGGIGCIISAIIMIISAPGEYLTAIFSFGIGIIFFLNAKKQTKNNNVS